MSGLLNPNGRMPVPIGGLPPMQPPTPQQSILRLPEAEHCKAQAKTASAKPKATGDRWALLNGIVDADDWAEMSPTEAKVLMFLFRHAWGDRAKISVNVVAARNGISRATAKRVLAALKTRGIVEQVKTGSNITHEPNTYRIRSSTNPPRG